MMPMDGLPGKEEKVQIEYTAQASSPAMNGEVRLKVDKNYFAVTGVFGAAEIPYAIVDSIEFANYEIAVRTDEGDYIFSRMGSWAQPFYDALCDAYGKAVLRSFFVTGDPALRATGDYRFTENGMTSSGNKALAQVYENCVTGLPPNRNARRIPLCFVSALEKGSTDITIRLNTGESYVFSKMGYDTAMFAETIEKQMRAMREKTVAMVKEIDASLSVNQASQIANLIPNGAAAQIGQLASIAPSFAAAIEEKLSKTRAADSYSAFR
ncbi:MAG: hypothetical protein FWH44_04650, partial [Methanomassiliicoccaceae archaeon]|nr:hypothetical protein [Methanomassiliicoccaceae archaeon]